MDKRYQIFVSSTYVDLIAEREIVIQTLIKMGYIPSGMELFPAADEEQFKYIKKVIDDCDYYLLIIGGRYGSTTSEGLSYTEKEYDYAVKKKIKVIALIHGKPSEIPSGKSETVPKLRKKLEAFRKKVATNRLVNFWTELSQLSGMVALNVAEAIRMYPAIGWVRANQVSNTELLTEVNELRKNKESLELQIATLKLNSSSSIFTMHEENEFNYVYSKIKGFQEVQLQALIRKTNDGEIPKMTSKDYIAKYSLIRVLHTNVKAGQVRFYDTFLYSLEDEANKSESFEKLLKQGYEFQFWLHNRDNNANYLRGTLTSLGFLTIENRLTNQFGNLSSDDLFNFTDKLFRFVTWLEYNNKIEEEPLVEFINFVEIE